MNHTSRKYTLILLAIGETFLIYRLVSAIIQKGLPTHPLYWLTAAVEIGLAYFTYRAYVSHVSYYKIYKKVERKKPLALFTIMVVAIGVPIVAAIIAATISIESLRPVGGGLHIYFMACGAFYLYQVFRKPKEITEDTEYISKGLVFAIFMPSMLLIIIFLIVFGLLIWFGKLY